VQHDLDIGYQDIVLIAFLLLKEVGYIALRCVDGTGIAV
jgi:hypothetical protein